MIDLLEYCVLSVEMDPLFCFLASDYRMLPTATKAVALYDVFCSPTTPARISAQRLLPPYDGRIVREIDLLRPQPPIAGAPEEEADEAEEDSPESDEDTEDVADEVPEPPFSPPTPLPAKYLFDTITGELERSSAAIRNIAAKYNPTQTPQENLPGGQLTAAQRQFVDGIWGPQMRPFLVDAGFFKIANIA